jgi:acid phosphatase
MKERAYALALLAATVTAGFGREVNSAGIESIDTIVVIYAENRSFDNLYGSFPGANGLAQTTLADFTQLDRDGSVLKRLPPVWGGLTVQGAVPAVTQAQTENLPNAPFAIDDPKGLNVPLGVTTRDLWHRFYQNQMQIADGNNNRFAAYADSGGLVMGHYASARLPLWDVARQYALADNFFMGAFGGSFLNHFVLICACAPTYPHADQSPAKVVIAAIEPDKVTLTPAPDSPKSALDGVPSFVNDGNLTPDFFAVNTMQPPYQPSANQPAPDGNPAYADPAQPTTLPPQTEQTIGDLLRPRGLAGLGMPALGKSHSTATMRYRSRISNIIISHSTISQISLPVLQPAPST